MPIPRHNYHPAKARPKHALSVIRHNPHPLSNKLHTPCWKPGNNVRLLRLTRQIVRILEQHRLRHAPKNNCCITFWCQVAQIQRPKINKPLAQNDLRDVPLVLKRLRDTFGAKIRRPTPLRPNALPTLADAIAAEPVIPINIRPVGSQFLPQRPRQHPAEPREEVGPVQLFRARAKVRPAVVVPRRDTEERWIGVEDGREGAEVGEEVLRHLEVVLEDDDARDGRLGESARQGPAIMARDAHVRDFVGEEGVFVKRRIVGRVGGVVEPCHESRWRRGACIVDDGEDVVVGEAVLAIDGDHHWPGRAAVGEDGVEGALKVGGSGVGDDKENCFCGRGLGEGRVSWEAHDFRCRQEDEKDEEDARCPADVVAPGRGLGGRDRHMDRGRGG